VELLQFYPVIQLFDTIVRLPKGALSETPDALRYPGFAFHALEDPAFLLGSEGVHIGLPGFAWAARRSVIEQVGFYDAAVVGGADRLMAQTWFGYYEFPTFDAILPPKARKTFYHWAVRAARSVQGRPGYLPGTLLHLWHGEHVDRQYNERHTVLKTYDFDPCTDLKTNALGCWEWNSDKKAMHDVIKSYFLLRKEDG
jgi:hypothetical protein